MSRSSQARLPIAREQCPAIVIVDPQVLVRSLLCDTLMSRFDSFDVVTCSALDEIERITDREIKLVILRLPSMSGSGSLLPPTGRDDASSGTRVMLLCEHEDDVSASDVFALGYRGIISAATPVEVMVAAIQLVLAGGVYFPHPFRSVDVAVASEVAGGACETMLSNLPHGSVESSIRLNTELIGFGLTVREREVLAQLCRGRPNKLIARDLSISENTAKMHVRRILLKLRVRNRTEAALMLQSRLGS